MGLRKPPTALFVLVFEALILLVIILLASGNSSQANSVALFAFYALTISVVALVASSITRETKHARATKTN